VLHTSSHVDVSVIFVAGSNGKVFLYRHSMWIEGGPTISGKEVDMAHLLLLVSPPMVFRWQDVVSRYINDDSGGFMRNLMETQP
jgi:hypothetical protein